MVHYAGSPMSPEVSLQFSILSFFDLVRFSLWMVYFLCYELVVHAVAWKSPKFSLVLELGSAIM